jgi:hypothetical protein
MMQKVKSMRRKIDLLLWRYLVPKLRQAWFQLKVVQLVAVGYVSCFALPRQFLRHYFEGNGAAVWIDGAELIRDNPHLLALIRHETRQKQQGRILLSQAVLSDPKWKYSVGSSVLSFKRQSGGMELSLESRYHYQSESSRLTKHLHQWLSGRKNAQAFPVYSQPFHIGHDQMDVPYSWSEMSTSAPFAFYLLV